MYIRFLRWWIVLVNQDENFYLIGKGTDKNVNIYLIICKTAHPKNLTYNAGIGKIYVNIHAIAKFVNSRARQSLWSLSWNISQTNIVQFQWILNNERYAVLHETSNMTNLWIAAESTLGNWKTIPLIISALKVSHVLKLCSQGWLFTTA